MPSILVTAPAILSQTSARWSQLAQSLPLEVLNEKPSPGEWSALECLQHLLDVEAVFFSRLQAFLAGQDFPAYNPDLSGASLSDPAALAQQFSLRRARSLEALQAVTPADLARSVRHQELGPVTLNEMLNEWAGHDLMHTVQAERALMQPFILGCGPWAKYFADHRA